MARKSLSLTDYQQLADEHGLVFVGEVAPRLTTTSAVWRCKNCGKERRTAYSNIKQNKYTCECQWKTLKREDYEQLAKRIGIAWVGPFPPNVRSETMWQNDSGVCFLAAYRDLAYKIPERLKEYLP